MGTISVRSKTVYGRAPTWEKSSTKPEKAYASALLVVFASALGKSTHCYTAIHGPFLRRVDEKEGHSRNEYNGSNDTNILLLQLSQIFSIILVEDNKEDVPRCGECPEYICQWKPANPLSTLHWEEESQKIL